jgi:preprotein translocase subunit YajC
MFISTAHAAETAAAMQGDPILSFLPFFLILAVFWFLIWRPQMRKQKEHLEMVNTLRRGDRVVTSGGIIGEVSKLVDDATIELKIADNVIVKMARHHVTDTIDRGQPATTSEKSSKPAKTSKKAK